MAGLDILLATRNGERFVEEQIRSLQSQTFKDWTLLVHDDGSVDATMDIVRSIAGEDSRIQIIEDGIRLGSAPGNFLHLLKHSKARRIMFCDQDDIWFQDKIEKMMKRGELLKEDIPGVVYSRANYWNPERGVMGHTWPRYPVGLAQFLTQKAAVQGSAALINGKMRETMLSYEGPMVMHDHLLGLIANSFGRVEMMDEILMNYRQHDANVTGNSDETKKGIQWYLTKLRNYRPVMDRKTLDSTRSFYERFYDFIPEDRRHIFEAFFRLEDQSRPGRVLSAWRNGFARDGSVRKLMVKMLLCSYIKD